MRCIAIQRHNNSEAVKAARKKDQLTAKVYNAMHRNFEYITCEGYVCADEAGSNHCIFANANSILAHNIEKFNTHVFG